MDAGFNANYQRVSGFAFLPFGVTPSDRPVFSRALMNIAMFFAMIWPILCVTAIWIFGGNIGWGERILLDASHLNARLAYLAWLVCVLGLWVLSLRVQGRLSLPILATAVLLLASGGFFFRQNFYVEGYAASHAFALLGAIGGMITAIGTVDRPKPNAMSYARGFSLSIVIAVTIASAGAFAIQAIALLIGLIAYGLFALLALCIEFAERRLA